MAEHPPDLGASSPDVMNDPAYAPSQRRDTLSSVAGSERVDTCRICRSDGSIDEPLFHPCKCSGSIKFVHQDCLMEWLSHSHKKHCELCKTPFRFTKLYDADMPSRLPWAVFVKRACMHAGFGVLRLLRILLVASVWLGLVPLMLRWAWRWMFWIADAAWAREALMEYVNNGSAALRDAERYAGGATNETTFSTTFHQYFKPDLSQNMTAEPFAYTFANAVARNLGFPEMKQNRTTTAPTAFHWPQSDPSVLSSWAYLASLTSNPHANRLLLDVFEGQLITCVVIVGFILVFLIREWVVQQQPLVNLDNIGNVQQQLQEAAERVQAENDRGQRQQELLEQAQRRLTEFQDEINQDAGLQQMPEATNHPGGNEGEHTVNENHSSRSPRPTAVLDSTTTGINASSHPEPSISPRDSANDGSDGQWRETLSTEEMPITNAGPDAKINIRFWDKRTPTIPALTDRSKVMIKESMVDADQMKKALEKEVDHEMKDLIDNERITISADTATTESPAFDAHRDGLVHDNSSVADHNEAESGNRESFLQGPGEHNQTEASDRVSQPAEIYTSRSDVHSITEGDGQNEESGQGQIAQEQPIDIAQRGLFQIAADWFWGDIAPQEPDVLRPFEERQQQIQDENAQPNPLGAGNNDQPVFEEHGHPPVGEQQHRDPEVVDAAAQAGLDAEAIEDAEDMEGVLELIGIQGPIIGLFQTSAFCTLLVGATILCAVVLPYLGGKLTLSFVASPIWFCFKAPLQLASFVADVVIDLAIVCGGWLTIIFALVYDFLSSAFEAWMPQVLSRQHGYVDNVLRYATSTTSDAAARIESHFAIPDLAQGVGWSWVLLAASAHSHASLTALEKEIDQILVCAGNYTGQVVEIISSRKILRSVAHGLSHAPRLLISLYGSIVTFSQLLQDFFVSVRAGALTFESSSSFPMEPALVYWNSTDRTLAIIAGYIALAALATVYVAMDTPITRSESGQKTEKMVRDTLRQAGGVLKVILIISIEMLIFPLYCGLLLDLAFLPLFREATVATRWAFASTRPYTFCFVHWFVGTCYMFHFALFVGMCRKILRKGVLWFIRDPDDPNFHPVRDVLERGVMTQLRKIAFSGLVYGALVILCLGGVIWTIDLTYDGLFPVHWVSTEPVFEFPMDLLLYNFVTPLAIRLFRPSEIVHSMYGWWLRRCARVLRLSHFLFDDRRKDEEGHRVRLHWTDYLPSGRSYLNQERTEQSNSITTGDFSESVFHPDGKYVLTPCDDQYRPPKPGEAFLNANDDDVYISDKKGKRNDYFAKVYIPPFFRLRISLFMVCLWAFSAILGLCTTLLPLIFGRYLFARALPNDTRVNDIYAYSIGSYILGGASLILFGGRAAIKSAISKLKDLQFRAWISCAQELITRTAKCVFVFGFLGGALPLVFAMALQLYIILPLHTFVTPAADTSPLNNESFNETAWSQMETNTTLLPPPVWQPRLPDMAHHTIHIMQDYALGLLYVRIASRFFTATPTSRAGEAFRRITADGISNPNVRLATRFFILPATLVSGLIVIAPPLIAKVSLAVASTIIPDVARHRETIVYRYSYPLLAICALLIFAVLEIAKATARWRARIRDEVYLVGEKLHNFGERRPPVGSRSVVRRER